MTGTTRMRWWRRLKTFHQEEAAQDVLEYALILAMVAVAAVGSSQSLASTLSSGIAKLLTKVQASVDSIS